MRVLHLIDKSFVGGGQTIVRDMTEGLTALGVDVEVACRTGGPLVPAIERLGVRVHHIPFDKRFRPGPARAIARLVADRQFDIVHGHGLVATTYAALARRFLRMAAPVVYHQHGFHHHNYGWTTRGFRRASERWVATTASVTIASNLADFHALVAGGYAPPSRMVVLPNGVPEPTPSADEIRQVALAIPDDGRPCVGVLARLHPQKAVDVLLRAAVTVSTRMPTVRFVIAGTGPLEDSLRALAESLGLAKNVLFTGALPGRACVPRFDVAVLCSKWEGLPITLLEYMAGRRAIVATALPPCQEVLGEGAAEMIPVDDPDALAASILRLLTDTEHAHRCAANARQRYEAHYTLMGVARRYHRLYETLLASPLTPTGKIG